MPNESLKTGNKQIKKTEKYRVPVRLLLCDTIILLHTESFESGLGTLTVEAPTAIEAIRDGRHAASNTSLTPSDPHHNRAYDLSGRKVRTTRRGLYIQKNRKYIINTTPAQ